MKTYVIDDRRGTRAEILPRKGATLVSLQKDGREFIYRDDENLESPERPRCGIPFLFPIFGRLQDSSYTWDGKQYPMEIHGFGHTTPWQVSSHTEDTLCLTLEASHDTLSQYPFPFRVSLTFQVSEGTLTIAQKYENPGTKPMPYNYGFHPYFLAEKPEDIRVETTAQPLFDFAAGPKPFGSDSIRLSVPQGAPETGAALMGVTGPTILHWEDGRKLTMTFDESFHTHVLWTQAGKHFLCVEPVNGTANGLNTGNYLTLMPGESKEAFLQLRPERE